MSEPTTAAGRAFLTNEGAYINLKADILAIEAEARAAALDEARAAVEGAMSNDGWQRKVNVLAAIDALREGRPEPWEVEAMHDYDTLREDADKP